MILESSCAHADVSCLNQHELIRKYRCADCGAVMMCACDEQFGRRFLAHQLDRGVDLDTRQRVPVTLGFQPGICNACRGLPAVSAPAAAIPGRTSKIKRYYWRELYRGETERFGDWCDANPDAPEEEKTAADKQIARTVLEEIKALHDTAPIYDTHEPSAAEVLARCHVEVQAFWPVYAASPEKGAVVVLDGETVSPEVFVSRQFEAEGWSAMPLESAPLHVLFGTMMWLLICHPSDPKCRPATFGSRLASEAGVEGDIVWTHLPEDFGTAGYGRRRKEAIDEHFDFLLRPDGAADRGNLLDLFDYWLRPSAKLREYLWAHRDADVDRARRLIEVLPADAIIAILRYLVEAYWDRFVGWPDLLLWRDETYLLVEVKSSSDRFSNEQLCWISDNHARLNLPFRVAKLHRPSGQSRPN